MPGTAYKDWVGAEEDSGFVSAEDVFETGPSEVYHASSGSCSEAKPPNTPVGGGF